MHRKSIFWPPIGLKPQLNWFGLHFQLVWPPRLDWESVFNWVSICFAKESIEIRSFQSVWPPELTIWPPNWQFELPFPIGFLKETDSNSIGLAIESDCLLPCQMTGFGPVFRSFSRKSNKTAFWIGFQSGFLRKTNVNSIGKGIQNSIFWGPKSIFRVAIAQFVGNSESLGKLMLTRFGLTTARKNLTGSYSRDFSNRPRIETRFP